MIKAFEYSLPCQGAVQFEQAKQYCPGDPQCPEELNQMLTADLCDGGTRGWLMPILGLNGLIMRVLAYLAMWLLNRDQKR